VPFALVTGTATNDFTAFAAYIANSIDLDGVSGAGFGGYTAFNALCVPGPVLCSGSSQGATMYTKDADNMATLTRPRYISTNYFHMGNMWRRYRVLSSTLTFSCENMMFQNSTGSNRATAHGVLNLFASPEAESVADVGPIVQNWTRPAIFGQRHGKTHTILNQYTTPSSIRYTCSASSLMRSQYPGTIEEFSGGCVQGSSGGVPTYTRPQRKVYHGWTFHPYGACGTAPRTNFLPSSTLLSGYITVSYKCHFTDPHVNSDFVAPL